MFPNVKNPIPTLTSAVAGQECRTQRFSFKTIAFSTYTQKNDFGGGQSGVRVRKLMLINMTMEIMSGIRFVKNLLFYKANLNRGCNKQITGQDANAVLKMYKKKRFCLWYCYVYSLVRIL